MSAAEQNPVGRFVILRHEGTPQYKPGVHWDLMFEFGSALKTWALGKLPAPQHVVTAEQLPDHRLAYLEYEGPVSRDRGTVGRFDFGQYQLIEHSDERWVVALTGERLRGRLVLVRVGGSPRWQCTLVAT
jgi:hypothetical protein